MPRSTGLDLQTPELKTAGLRCFLTHFAEALGRRVCPTPEEPYAVAPLRGLVHRAEKWPFRCLRQGPRIRLRVADNKNVGRFARGWSTKPDPQITLPATSSSCPSLWRRRRLFRFWQRRIVQVDLYLFGDEGCFLFLRDWRRAFWWRRRRLFGRSWFVRRSF